jgi:hypothetical protein
MPAEGLGTNWTGISAMATKQRSLVMEKNEKVVLDAMKKAAKPLRPGDVIKLVDIDAKEVSKIIDSLKKQGKVISPKRCYYAPAED